MRRTCASFLTFSRSLGAVRSNSWLGRTLSLGLPKELRHRVIKLRRALNEHEVLSTFVFLEQDDFGIRNLFMNPNLRLPRY